MSQSRSTTLSLTYAGKPLSVRYDGLATPARNRPLMDREYQLACTLADRIRPLRMEGAVLGQEATIARGANAWAGGQEANWHPLFNKDRRDFDHLRLYCQPFTGFDPIEMRIYGGAPASIPEDIEARLARTYTTLSITSVELVADQRRLPEHVKVRLPLVFGEVGPVLDGVVASYDSWSLQLQMNGLHGSGVLDRLRAKADLRGRVTVADIGSGFGGIGYQLGRALDGRKMRFIAIDLPDSLLFAAIYLSILWEDHPTYLALPEGYLRIGTETVTKTPPGDFAALFVVTYLADRVLAELAPIDLMLNFRSMQEMSDAQVGHYGELARAHLAGDGLLYEQNGISRDIDRDVKAILGRVLPKGGLVAETDPQHRGMSPASCWGTHPLEGIRLEPAG